MPDVLQRGFSGFSLVAENHRKGFENIWIPLDFSSRTWKRFLTLKVLDFCWTRSKHINEYKFLSQWKQMHRWTTYQLLEMLTKCVICSQCPFVTLAHVHWVTSAGWMSGLHARVFKFSLSSVSVYARVYIHHKHFVWFEINSYIKKKSLKFQRRPGLGKSLKSPWFLPRIRPEYVYEHWLYLKANIAINWD